MSTPPQQPYAAYPRATAGASDRLQALADGYFGLNWAFVITLVLNLVVRLATAQLSLPVQLIATVLEVLAVGYICSKYVNRIGFGANWPSNKTTTAVVLMGFNALCCGILGFIVMQQIAANHIKGYGIRGGFFGLKKRDIVAAIANLKQQERQTTPRV